MRMFRTLAASAAAAAMLTACSTSSTLSPRAVASAATFDWFTYEGSDPVDPQATPGPGEYRNPVIAGYYPDPSITRVGDDYYLVNSTFTHFPGIPIFHSRDLVNWTQIGNAIDRADQLDFGNLGLSRGVFAPTIEHHDGTFYILNTCVDCGGNFVITATDPRGPWSDPVWIPDVGGIDPSLFFDDDGSAYLMNNDAPEGEPLYEGHRAIWIRRFDPKTLKTIGPRKLLINGGVDLSTKPIWIEGPHIFKKDGLYYLSAAEGGTAEGHSQVVLRATEPMGPYVPWEGNPILTQRDLPRDRLHPITSAGHADMVQTPNGEWWATFLAVRPYADDMYNIGRETFLMPVRWEDGWPRITSPGETIPYVHRRPALPAQPTAAVPTTGPFSITQQFDGQTLPFHWMMMRNPRENWYRLEGGALEIEPRPVVLGEKANPSFLGRRQQHLNASASTVVRFAPDETADEAGLAAVQSEDYWYLLAVGSEGGRPVVRLKRRAGSGDDIRGETIASAPLNVAPGAPVYLKIQARGPRYDFLYGHAPDQWTTLKQDADGTILSTKVAGGFVGTLLGLYAFDDPREN